MAKLTKLQQIMKQDIERAIRWWLPDNYRLADRRVRKDAGVKKLKTGGIEDGKRSDEI